MASVEERNFLVAVLLVVVVRGALVLGHSWVGAKAVFPWSLNHILRSQPIADPNGYTPVAVVRNYKFPLVEQVCASRQTPGEVQLLGVDARAF